MSAAANIYESDFEFIRQLVRDRAAIVLDKNQNYLIVNRLQTLVEQEHLESLPQLITKARSSTGGYLATKIVEAMTTNETSFFRDVAPFACLQELVLPTLINARTEQNQLNMWCGACSTGQEPYSIAILLKDNFPDLDNWDITFFATDLNSKVLEKTQTGLYSQVEVNRGLPVKYLVKYFQRKGLRWEISSDIKNMLELSTLNIIDPWPNMGLLDIIFMRNILIYFDVETKKTILHRVKSILAPDGYLFLGGAETTIGLDDAFERVNYPNASCYCLKK